MILTVPQDATLYPTLGPQVCDWIESELCFGPGDLRGQPAVIDDEKRMLIYSLYEVFPKGHPQAGRRRFKRAGISEPKGVAKTELAAWLALAELSDDAPVRCVGFDKQGQPIGGPVTDPFVILVAYTEEQSDELAYSAMRAILQESAIGRKFDIGLERIVRKDGAGKAVSVAAAPNARDGARTTFQCFDETHRMTLDRLKRAHQTMMANLPKRKLADPWALEITTAPEPGAGSIAEATMDYALQIRDGAISDASLFFFHRQASDHHDLTTKEGVRAAIIEAAGPAAAWRDNDAIAAQWDDPTTDKAYLERVYCNRLVKGGTQAFDVELWKTLRRVDRPVKRGDRITIGFDGSQVGDATGIVCTHVDTGFQWVAGLWERPVGLPLDAPWRVDVESVDATMRALFAEYQVMRLYADPPHWQTWIAVWRGEWGEERVVEWWTNRPGPMSTALENFTTAMGERTIAHDGNPDYQRHIGNSRKRELAQYDDQGRKRWVISKDRHDSPNKIDLAMAGCLSWEARADVVASGALKVAPVTVEVW